MGLGALQKRCFGCRDSLLLLSRGPLCSVFRSKKSRFMVWFFLPLRRPRLASPFGTIVPCPARVAPGALVCLRPVRGLRLPSSSFLFVRPAASSIAPPFWLFFHLATIQHSHMPDEQGRHVCGGCPTLQSWIATSLCLTANVGGG